MAVRLISPVVVSIDISSPRLIMAADNCESVAVEEVYCPGIRKGIVTDGQALLGCVSGFLEKVNNAPRQKIIGAGVALAQLQTEGSSILGGQSIGQLTKIFLQSGLSPRVYIPSIQASARAVLSKAEMQVGVILVELGHSNTGVALYNHGGLKAMDFIPVGESHIIADLAVGFRVSLEEAERIKDNPLEGDGETNFTRQYIMESRIFEIFHLVKKCIFTAMGDWQPPGGIVLTGPGAGLHNMADYARDIVIMPSRIGLGALPGVPEHPAYAATIGLLMLYRDSDGDRHSRGKSKMFKYLVKRS